MKLFIITLLLSLPGVVSPMEQQNAVAADEAGEDAELSAVARELINKVRNHPNLKLMRAIEAHNVEAVRTLLQDPSINVNYRAHDNFEEAEKHFKAGNITQGELLEVYRADEYNGRVALYAAIEQFRGTPGQPEYDDETKQAVEAILHLILSQPGVNPNRCDYDGWCPLAFTILSNTRREGNEATDMERAFEILMKYHSHAKATGAIPLDLNIEGQGRTPLMVAVENGQWRLAQLLLDQPEVNPLLSGKNGGRTLLHALAKNRQDHLAQRMEAREIFLGLVERGCRVNALMNAPISRVSEDGITKLPPLPTDKFVAPLEVALHEGNIDATSLLTLAFKAKLGPKTFYLEATPNLNFDEARMLSTVKTNIESPDKLCDLCMTAAARGYTQALIEIMRKNPQLILTKFSGWTTLDFAMYNGQGDVVRLLLSQSAIKPDERKMRPWVAAGDRGLTPCRLAKMGEAAREKDREEWAIFKNAEATLSENSECSQEPKSNSALEVFGEFNHARATAFMAMRQYIKETLRKEVPREIVRAIAHGYRFPLKTEASAEQGPIINNNNNNNNNEPENT